MTDLPKSSPRPSFFNFQTGLILAVGVFILSLALTFAPPPLKDTNVLYLYHWVDNFAPQTIAKFEKETGIRVFSDVYDSNEILEAKLLTGNAGYDLVFPTAWPYFARQVRAGLYQPIDRSKITHWKDLETDILEHLAEADPGNQYGVPFTWGTTGFAYNADKILSLMPEAPVDSLRMLYDPEIVSRFTSCGVSLLEEPIDVLGPAFVYLGLDPNTTDPKDLAKVKDLLVKVRSYVTRFSASRALTDLANGDLCLIQAWSGDISMMRKRLQELGDKKRIEFVIPKEGAGMWQDVMAIPKDAPHIENAHKFIDFLLRPDIMAEIGEVLTYAIPSQEAYKLLSSEVKKDPIIYPSKTIRERLYNDRVISTEWERLRSRTLTHIKTGQ